MRPRRPWNQPSRLTGVRALRLPPVFVGWAELAAELVNTRPRPTDPEEKLVGLDDLARLLGRCPEPAPVSPRERDLGAVRALRPALLEAFEAPTREAFAAAVNPLLARARGGWRLATLPGGDWALEPADAPPQALADWVAARTARGLTELAMAYGIERLHVCAADDCLRAVVDASRNGTRRYCSRTCATRVNVRRHRGAD